MAMLRAVVALKESCGGSGTVYVAHLNHGLRGAAADADQAWLETLCGRFRIPLTVGRFDLTAAAVEQADGWEAAARDARYSFLRSTAEQLGARFVAAAHTADDQVETVLHHILRGTGLAGLAGMPGVRSLSRSVSLVRPLLHVHRDDVLEYLAAIGQEYRTDESNANVEWTRNRLRRELLPLLRERYNEQVDGALLRLASQAGEAQQLIAALAANLARESTIVEFPSQPAADRCGGQNGSQAAPPAAFRVRIDCGRLAGQSPLVVREVCKGAWSGANWPLQAMGFAEWQQLAELVQGLSDRSAANLPGNVRSRREKNVLVLEVFG